MTRKYDMERRAEAAEETRRRIIDAAHAILDRPEGGPLSLQEVASLAGVTRATIHNRVGSRAQLLEAVFKDQGRRIDFDRVLEALEIEDPVEAITTTVREACRAWAVSPLAIRRTLALAVLDPEVAPIVAMFEAERGKRFRPLIDRLRGAGVLAADLDPDDALRALLLATSFPSYDAVLRFGSHASAERLLTRQLLLTLGLDRGP